MIEFDKKECAKSYRDILNSEKTFAQRRGSELADEFTRLEVQVATVLIAFTGIFLNSFEGVFLMKLTYAFSLFFLIASLGLGLVHIKRKEKFWDEVMNAKFVAYKKWFSTLQGDGTTFNEAKAYQMGTAQEKGNIIHSPLWTWILQTACLAIAIILFFVIFLVLIFTK